jgi:hypothetical protein
MNELCHDHAKENGESAELCGRISSAADAAYAAAASSQQTSFLILANGFVIMGLWIYSLQKKLEKLETKSDV